MQGGALIRAFDLATSLSSWERKYGRGVGQIGVKDFSVERQIKRASHGI